MSDQAKMAERHGRILAELSELGQSLACDLHRRALAAETPEAAASLAGAFHRISRSVRQSLALEARLERDRRRGDREDRAEAVRQAQSRVERRKAQVRAAVERLIWTEAEPDEAERLVDDLDDLLAEQELSDSFGQDPLDAHIERIRADLGLSGPPATDSLPPVLSAGREQGSPWSGRPSAEPPDSAPDSPPDAGADRRSSA